MIGSLGDWITLNKNCSTDQSPFVSIGDKDYLVLLGARVEAQEEKRRNLLSRNLVINLCVRLAFVKLLCMSADKTKKNCEVCI